MRATVMYGAGDVRIETVPDAHLIDSTDALVRVSRAGICGSDLWPCKSMEPSETGRCMGYEFIGVVAAVGTRPIVRSSFGHRAAACAFLALPVLRHFGRAAW
jgi:threonine dehydrogenase-like Zn-dependent dehydrogenase